MEIERKFTLKRLPANLEQYPHYEIEQAYLNVDPVIRIRKQDDDYYGALSEIEQMFDGEAKARGKAVLTDKSGNNVTDSIDTFGNDKNAAYKRR